MEQKTEIPLDHIGPNPYQPRQNEDLEAIKELAESIKRNGLLQVPTARLSSSPFGPVRYELAFGHTRKAAYAYLAETEGWDPAMPLIIRDLSDVQMFEMAVAENIKRRDLNAIEQAESMRRYMEEFGKTSKEAGEFFNVSEETVRGTVRLNNLVPEAKEQLRAGKITVSIGRSLLSLQKIASNDVVAETVKRIERESDSALPEEVIENMVDRLDNVVEMWPSHRSGKPRGGYELWLLDMKNFPNKLLPELTVNNVAFYLGPSDKKQKMIDAWIEAKKSPLSDPSALDIEPELVEKLEHLSNPPACTACSFYTQINKSHYCGMKICHDRKEIAWRVNQITQASKTLGIPLYDETDGRYVVLQSHNDKCNSLFTKRDKSLRLVAKSNVTGYHHQNFKGVDDDVFFVVAIGDVADKLAVTTGAKSGGGKKSEKEKAEMRAMRLYRARRKEVMWEYCGVAQKYFDGIPLSVLECIEMHSGYVGVDEQIPDAYEVAENAKAEAKMEFKRREIVWNLIFDLSSHFRREPLMDQLEAFADRMAIPAPKELIKRAKEWDAEIEALAKVTPEKGGKK